MYFDNHSYTIKAAVKMVWATSPKDVTMIRIKNTLELEYIYISENLAELAKQDPSLEIVSEPRELIFDENGDLF